jgi:GNAT superfamily N-acetyltransferase
MRIETAHEGDLDAVVALLAEQFREHRIDLKPDQLSEAVRGVLAHPSRGTILLGHDPEPVAVAVLAFTWTLEQGGHVAWLDELFVLHERRGHGIGRALLGRALEAARECGCLAVELEVDAEHSDAERLYRREGFTELPRRRWARRFGP